MAGSVKNLAILGSTGSIGRQTLQVVRNLAGRFRVVGLAARTKPGTVISANRRIQTRIYLLPKKRKFKTHCSKL